MMIPTSPQFCYAPTSGPKMLHASAHLWILTHPVVKMSWKGCCCTILLGFNRPTRHSRTPTPWSSILISPIMWASPILFFLANANPKSQGFDWAMDDFSSGSYFSKSLFPDLPYISSCKTFIGSLRLIATPYIYSTAFILYERLMLTPYAFFGPGQFRSLYPHLVRPAADSRFHIVGEAASVRRYLL